MVRFKDFMISRTTMERYLDFLIFWRLAGAAGRLI